MPPPPPPADTQTASFSEPVLPAHDGVDDWDDDWDDDDSIYSQVF